MPDTAIASRWHFNGDVNLEYGGAFIDLSNWDYGYAECVRVTDLDRACGFTGAVLIEHVIINGLNDAERIRKACKSCGNLDGVRNWHSIGDKETIKENLRHAIADALLNYGYFDPDNNWNGQWSGRSECGQSEVVQCEPDGPMLFDGWKATKRLNNTTLESYVESVHLRD